MLKQTLTYSIVSFFLINNAQALNWALAARVDLKKIHSAILQDASIIVTPHSKQFNYRFYNGYKKSLTMTKKVKNYAGYYYLLSYFVNGLQTPHFALIPQRPLSTKNLKWPKFIVNMHDGNVIVTYVSKDVDQQALPVMGAELISCDGLSVDQLFKKIVAPFMYHNHQYKQYWSLYTSSLLLNYGNPFVIYPKRCTFRVNNHVKQYSLNWQPFSAGEDQLNSWLKQNNLLTKTSIQEFGKDSVWIRLPSFASNYKKRLADVAKKVKAFRYKDTIVFDVRNNPGGEVPYNILINLYGSKYLASLGNKLPMNITRKSAWRVTKSNRNYIKNIWRDKRTAKKMTQALHKHKKIVIITNKPTLKSNNTKTPNPVTAKVIVLTNANCWSACWLFVRDLKAIPGTIQAGQLTGIMSRYSDPRVFNLRRGIMKFQIPIQTILQPTNHLGKPFIPDITFQGDISNTNAVKQWILNIGHLADY